MRNMEAPDNLIDQIHYDLCHGKIQGPEILLTQAQIEEAAEHMPLRDGQMLLGKRIRVTDGEPSVKFPPDEAAGEWKIGGMMGGADGPSIVE